MKKLLTSLVMIAFISGCDTKTSSNETKIISEEERQAKIALQNQRLCDKAKADALAKTTSFPDGTVMQGDYQFFSCEPTFFETDNVFLAIAEETDIDVCKPSSYREVYGIRIARAEKALAQSCSPEWHKMSVGVSEGSFGFANDGGFCFSYLGLDRVTLEATISRNGFTETEFFTCAFSDAETAIAAQKPALDAKKAYLDQKKF